jgi:hypothetical protein
MSQLKTERLLTVPEAMFLVPLYRNRKDFIDWARREGILRVVGNKKMVSDLGLSKKILVIKKGA